jgi:hypothetical protein
MVGFHFRIFMYSDNVQIKACDCSQASRRYPWRVLAKSKPNQLVPVQLSGRAFEGVWTPLSVQQLYIEDVRTTEQHRPDATSISIQQGVGFQKSTLLGSLYKPFGRRGNTSERCSAFQNIPVFSSNSTRSYSEDHLDAQSSHLDVDLIKIELHCFWKDIEENRPDVANLCSDARQQEPESQQF